MAQKPIGLRLDEGLLERVDRARGSTSRAAFVAAALEAVLAGVPVPSIGSPPKTRHRIAKPAKSEPKPCASCGGLGGSHQRGCKVARR